MSFIFVATFLHIYSKMISKCFVDIYKNIYKEIFANIDISRHFQMSDIIKFQKYHKAIILECFVVCFYYVMHGRWTLKFNFDTYLFLMINNKYK